MDEKKVPLFLYVELSDYSGIRHGVSDNAEVRVIRVKLESWQSEQLAYWSQNQTLRAISVQED